MCLEIICSHDATTPPTTNLVEKQLFDDNFQ